MADTGIQWTDKTWNPTTGCTRVSEGCRNCYAFALHDMRHEAHKAGKKVPKQYAKPFKELQLFEDRLTNPLSWRKPCMVFVNSMSDLFHKDVPDEFIDRVFAIMALAGEHTFQVLTKRPERMQAYLSSAGVYDRIYEAMVVEAEAADIADFLFDVWPLPNVWLGTSVENQQAADERIPLLLQTPAAVRFLSCEPLLGPVNLEPFLAYPPFHENYKMTFGMSDFRGVDWVIVGGESGHGARPMYPDWARSIRDQCQAAGVAFFFKQWGEFRPGGAPVGIRMEWVHPSGLHYGTGEPIRGEGLPVETMARVGKKAAGRLLDGREWNEFPRTEAAHA